MARFSNNPDKIKFSREPSVELDPLENFQPYGLTPREIELLSEVAQGKINKKVGVILGISPRTVSKHLEHIYTKLGVYSRTAAVVWFFEIKYQARKSKNAGFILKPVKISEGGSVVAPSTDIAQKELLTKQEIRQRKHATTIFKAIRGQKWLPHEEGKGVSK